MAYLLIFNIFNIWFASSLGIGFASIIIDNYLIYYYNIILAWAVYYMILSFTSVLPWSHCENEWNTPSCLDPQLLYDAVKAANSTAQCGLNSTADNYADTDVMNYVTAPLSGGASVMSLMNVSEAPSVMSAPTTAAKTVMVCVNGTLRNARELTPAVVEFWE